MIKGDYVRKVNKHCPLDGVQVSLSFIQENRSSAKKATEKMYICTTVLLTIPWSCGSGAGSPSVSGLRVVTMSSSCLYSWPCASWRRALGPAFPLSPFTVYSVVIGLLGIVHVDTVTSNTPLKVGVGSAISILYPIWAVKILWMIPKVHCFTKLLVLSISYFGLSYCFRKGHLCRMNIVLSNQGSGWSLMKSLAAASGPIRQHIS